MKNWLNTKTIKKEIDGEEVEFRRIPVGLLQKCRTLNESVSKALSMLFADKSKDVEVEQVSVPSDKLGADGNPIMSSEYKQGAIHVSQASMRATQMEQGIKGIIDSVTSDDTMKILSEIIYYSAYKEFEGVSKEDAISQIPEKMDTATLIQFIIGAFEASAGDYAKLGKSLFQTNKAQELVEKAKTMTT